MTNGEEIRDFVKRVSEGDDPDIWLQVLARAAANQLAKLELDKHSKHAALADLATIASDAAQEFAPIPDGIWRY